MRYSASYSDTSIAGTKDSDTTPGDSVQTDWSNTNSNLITLHKIAWNRFGAEIKHSATVRETDTIVVQNRQYRRHATWLLSTGVHTVYII